MTLPGADEQAAPYMGHVSSEHHMHSSHSDHDMSKMEHVMPKIDHGSHSMGSISISAQLGWVALSCVVILAGVYFTNMCTPINF